MSEPTFFAMPAELGAWLAEHHATVSELWVGFHKKSSGRPSVTWPEAVDEALCVGWIDGVRDVGGVPVSETGPPPRRAGAPRRLDHPPRSRAA